MASVTGSASAGPAARTSSAARIVRRIVILPDDSGRMVPGPPHAREGNGGRMFLRFSATKCVGDHSIAMENARLTRSSNSLGQTARERAMAWLRRNVEAAGFKPVLGGHVFQPPSAWLFGNAEHYLVTDAEKSR